MREQDLVKKAIEARAYAYAPYSEFMVGAALLTSDDTVFTGCNVENASYGATNCAERTAIFKAVSEGHTDFVKFAIAGGKRSETDTFTDYAYPCGICRQIMREFCSADFEIIVAKSINDYKVFSLQELLPNSFGPGNL